MRSPEEIKELIIEFAKNDDRVRAVLLNGSRANPLVAPDIHQDFDIVFIVKDLKSFTDDHSWTNYFGNIILSQRPAEVTFGKLDVPVKMEEGFTYLMLFADGNRIDLTLFPVSALSIYQRDSLTVVWLDKDLNFNDIPAASDRDYHVEKPTQKQFSSTCNEFWWVSTYVAKGLARQEIIYAKDVMERVVRPMFLNMIS